MIGIELRESGFGLKRVHGHECMRVSCGFVFN